MSYFQAESFPESLRPQSTFVVHVLIDELYQHLNILYII